MARAQRGILALDIGTSSVRAVVYDHRGSLLEPTYSDLPYRVDTKLPGQVSSDASALLALVVQAIDSALLAARRVQIEAVSASCYWHSLLGVDRKGKPTTEVLTWADTRSAQDGRALRATHDEHAYHARTGCFFHASYWPAKLRWLQRTRPAAIRRTRAWVSFAEYLYGSLFDERRVSLSMASGTGLFDPHRCRWDPLSLNLAGITEDQLSPIHDWDTAARGLQHRFAQRWPPLREIPWYLPLGDGAASNVGAGCLRPEWACAMVGTSGALRVIVAARDLHIPWGVFAYRLDRRRWVVGGALSEGGNVMRWLQSTLKLPHRKQLEAMVRALPADGHGLTVLPFWAGERSPNWRGDARAAVAGLSLASQPHEMVRATMEAITYQFGSVYDAMRRTVRRPRAVIASGGRLLHSALWMQMLADVLELPVVQSSEAEASSRGAALLALHALGRRPGLWREHPGRGRRFRPHPRAQAVYRAARERQADFYRLLFPAPGHPEDAPASGEAVSGSRMRDLRSPSAPTNP